MPNQGQLFHNCADILALIDKALGDISHQQIAPTSQVTDLLLDIRGKIKNLQTTCALTAEQFAQMLNDFTMEISTHA